MTTPLPFETNTQRPHYAARDALLLPGLLSLSRVPLAVCFVFVVDRPVAALSVLVASGITDVLDGWIARRFGMITPTGAALDPMTDKIFVLTVAITLVSREHMAASSALLLGARELAELPLVVWFALSPSARKRRAEHASANVPGKIATLLQFVTVTWALFHAPHLDLFLASTALAGAFAAFTYWKLALRNPGGRGQALDPH